MKILNNFKMMKISKDQCKDTGLAFVLILLILNFTFPGRYWLFIATAIIVLTMSAPGYLQPIARVWFGTAELIGTYVSKAILFVVFYGLVTPIGLLRRLFKKDSLKLKEFKKGRESVMDERNKTYKAEDLVKPF